MSLSTSLTDLPSIDVPALKKSSSATPLVKIGILVSDIPNVNEACPRVLKLLMCASISKPLAVNRAYSSSATELLSIFTALVFEIPNVN